PRERIEAFCRTWHITELALFGSVLRDDFRPDSDVDVLVTFEPRHHPGFRGWLAMEEERERMFSRPIDLVEKSSLTNPFRRHHVLHHQEVLYAY
ncbi:MAG TPA: nucleotidyltransferase domain-containing protein, partial [Longimicrobium sp.]|nr:nucleotidyltransferase domain-containing protein [Longimicrobium sp.]